jgi:peroxiredoxin
MSIKPHVIFSLLIAQAVACSKGEFPAFPDVQLKNLQTQNIVRFPGDGEKLLIIFSPFGCTSCMHEMKQVIASWQKTKGKAPEFFGIIETPFWQSAQLLREQLELSIPLYQDSTETLDRYFDRNGKPLLVHLKGNDILATFSIGLSENRGAIEQVLDNVRSRE